MSIVIGLDASTNEPVHARDATPGIIYTCPTCGVGMYARRRRSDKSDATFACAPNTRHENRWCIVKSGQQARIYDLKCFESASFFKKILTSQTEPDEKDTDKQMDEKDMSFMFDRMDDAGVCQDNGGLLEEDSGEEAKMSRITSLERMWDAGLTAMDPSTHLGGKRLANTLISSKGFSTFRNNEINGFRVIQARVDDEEPHDAEDDDLRIRFVAMKKKDGAWERKVIIVSFSNREQYNNVIRYLYKSSINSIGVKTWSVMHKSVLIAGQWLDRDKWACYNHCNKRSGCSRCFGLLTAEYTSKRQIYASDEPGNSMHPKEDDRGQ